MEIARSMEVISITDLTELYEGSTQRLRQYFVDGDGKKWLDCYDIERPLVAALCQGAAMHYHDKVNGIKDFDVWFFYPYNKKHLPWRTIWNWDYRNPKFGQHPEMLDYGGRKVDTIVRSIKNYTLDNPVESLQKYLRQGNTSSSRELAKKAAVLISPEALLGTVVWYKGELKVDI